MNLLTHTLLNRYVGNLTSGEDRNRNFVDYVFLKSFSHVAFPTAECEASKLDIPVQQHLENVLDEVRADRNLSSVSELGRDLHVWPDFHGNRSPVADPTLKGSISGLTIDTSVQNLALVYLAAVQAVAYGTKHIVQQMEKYRYFELFLRVVQLTVVTENTNLRRSITVEQ